MGTTAAGALALAPPDPALAQTLVPPSSGPCAVVGATVTCTGNVSAGVAATGPAINTLNVNSLSQAIAPAADVDGISFTTTSDITINADLAPFGISASGTGDGIDADLNGSGDVSVTSNGTIRTTTGDAINADVSVNGNITVNHTGDITAGGHGVRAYAKDSGNISVTVDGNIAVNNRYGVLAITGKGTTTITTTGTVSSRDGHGIAGVALEGSVVISSTGDVRASERVGPNPYSGISGGSFYNGGVVITSRGNVSGFYGIAGVAAGTGSVVIDTVGDITATHHGIQASQSRFSGSGDIAITSHGDITAGTGTGITGQVYRSGTVVLISNGTINAGASGIEASGGSKGGSGNITITSDGDITAGTGAGISGQVYNSGTVSITSNGNVTAQAANRNAVQTSVTPGSSSTVTLTGGTNTGGSGTGAGVAFLGAAGATNTLNTSGTVTLLSLGGHAVSGGAGDTTINNSGILNTVTNGAIDLGGGTNAFNNRGGAIFNSGGIVNLGAGNLFSNSGTLSPGASGAILTTAITGNLVQTGGGIFLASVDLSAGTGDLVTVTGTANLAGIVQAEVVNPGLGDRSVTILSAAGGTTDSGLALGPTSPALRASLSFPNANDVVLNTSIDFSVGGINPNQTALANSLNAVAAGSSGGVEPVLLALLNNVFTIGDYRNALNHLLPEVMLNTETATLFSSQEFIDNLFSCRLAGDNHTALSEGECYWARPQGRFLDRNSDANTIGFDETSGGLAAGAQVAVAPNWFAGFALGYERASLDTDTGAETDSNRFSGGLSLKYQAGSFLLGAAISGGVSGNDTQRPISFGGVGGFNATAESNYAIKTLTGQVRAAYVFKFRDWFAKPLVDVTATYLSRDGVTETGAGAANLAIAGGDDTFFSVTPALEIGGDFALSETSVIRPYVRAGVSFYTDSDHGLTAGFFNAPAGTSSFSINSSFDDVFADVAAGATAFFDNGSTLGLAYEGLISSDTQQHGISLKGTWQF